jgi:hypothetical protein
VHPRHFTARRVRPLSGAAPPGNAPNEYAKLRLFNLWYFIAQTLYPGCLILWQLAPTVTPPRAFPNSPPHPRVSNQTWTPLDTTGCSFSVRKA